VDHLLSSYDPRKPRYKIGDRVRVRSVREWSGRSYPDRPVCCTYHEAGGPSRSLSWNAEFDGWVGVTLMVFALTTPENLPAVRGSDGVLRAFHPDWLEAVTTAPAELTCTCELTALMAVGCRCGQMARERAVRCAV
jgi:hypothetical protein